MVGTERAHGLLAHSDYESAGLHALGYNQRRLPAAARPGHLLQSADTEHMRIHSRPSALPRDSVDET